MLQGFNAWPMVIDQIKPYIIAYIARLCGTAAVEENVRIGEQRIQRNDTILRLVRPAETGKGHLMGVELVQRSTHKESMKENIGDLFAGGIDDPRIGCSDVISNFTDDIGALLADAYLF